MAKPRSLPHPVLGNGDDVAGEFEARGQYRQRRTTIDIRIEFHTTNPTVLGLIEGGSAQYCSRIECARTYFRQAKRSRKTTQTHRFSSDELDGEVTITPMVVAIDRIDDYGPEGMHADYEGVKFTVEKGEIIAEGPPERLHVEKDFDPLKFRTASIVQVCQHEEAEGPTDFQFDGDIILVRIPKKSWPHYKQVEGHAAEALTSAIAVPAICRALTLMTEDDYKEYKWASVLRIHAEKKGISFPVEDPLDAVQVLLDDPISRGLRRLDELLVEDEE
jgi:hypothetical protein